MVFMFIFYDVDFITQCRRYFHYFTLISALALCLTVQPALAGCSFSHNATCSEDVDDQVQRMLLQAQRMLLQTQIPIGRGQVRNGRGLARTPQANTSFRNIGVLRGGGQQSAHNFTDLVAESRHAIGVLASTEQGHRLLNQVNNGAGLAHLHYTVLIEAGADTNQRMYPSGLGEGDPGSAATHSRIGRVEALPSGAIIGFNQTAAVDRRVDNVYTPRYMALGHELVHSHQGQLGLDHPKASYDESINLAFTLMLEAETVGLAGDFEISENSLRGGFGLPLRTAYSGYSMLNIMDLYKKAYREYISGNPSIGSINTLFAKIKK
jgi:hypothetical protein